MPTAEVFQIVGPEEGPLQCNLCRYDVAVIDMAMLIRKRKAGPFYPLCRDCAHRVLEAAMLTMALEEGVIDIATF